MQVSPNIINIHRVSASSDFRVVSTLILLIRENKGEETELTFNGLTSIQSLITLVIKHKRADKHMQIQQCHNFL